MASIRLTEALTKLLKHVRTRIAFDYPGERPSDDKLIETEEMVCVSSRAVFAVYVDRALWGDVGDDEMIAVEASLMAALGCVRVDSELRRILQQRLVEFLAFKVSREQEKVACER